MATKSTALRQDKKVNGHLRSRKLSLDFTSLLLPL